MSDSNRVRLALVEETTQGTTPNNPAFIAQRVTGMPLKFSPKTTVTDEIRSDRQVTDLILVDIEAGGAINWELSYGAQDTYIEAVLCAASWSKKPSLTNVTADSTITDAGTVANTYAVAAGGAAFLAGMLVRAKGFTNAANNQLFKVASSSATTIVGAALGLVAEAVPPAGASLQVVGIEGVAADISATAGAVNTLVSAALNFATLGLVAGEWIKIGGGSAGTGFATAANNGWARIASVSGGTLTLDIVPTGWTTDAGTGKTIRIWIGDLVRNASVERFFTFERAYLDNGSFEYFRGLQFDEFTLNLASADKVKGTVSLMGLSAALGNARIAGATDVAAPQNTPINAATNVGRVAEAGVAVVGPNYVKSAQISIKNNLRRQTAIGTLGAIGMGLGEFGVTGQIETFFGDNTLYNKLLNNTPSSLDFRLVDNGNRVILLDLPYVKYSDGSPDVSAKNSDVIIPLAFQALMHPTLGYTTQFQRFTEFA